MQMDKTTYQDLGIFEKSEDDSIFQHFDFTQTLGGKEWLRRIFKAPLTNIQEIQNTQRVIQKLMDQKAQWPAKITNGTLLVIHKLYDTPIDDFPANPNPFQSLVYKVFHYHDFSLLRFSIPHFVDFFKGMKQLIQLLETELSGLPDNLRKVVLRTQELLRHKGLTKLLKREQVSKLPGPILLEYAHFLLNGFKEETEELLEIYCKLEAYHSMAIAVEKFNLSFPQFEENEWPALKIEGLYHPLLPTPVAYDTELKKEKNFLFLTGANMAGKSTFIKAVGISVFLAHIGMGVPAKTMKLSLFNGLLSNIQVADNISKGESYFFNEVQRIKNTILTINDSRKWLILIDELFKGTNVQDAMKCSLAVIRGLVKIEHSLFVLSTHLYEIGEELKPLSNIVFQYFETNVKEDQLEFSYQLKDGISNDRLGYLILKREKVVDLLENL
jgi:DNA mismatch repair protein MutS